VNIIQDLGLVEAVLNDIAVFVSGQPVSTTTTLGKTPVSIAVVHLPAGPSAPFVAISGSFFSIFLEVLENASALADDQPMSLAIKEGNSWYGVTITLMPPSPAESDLHAGPAVSE